VGGRLVKTTLGLVAAATSGTRSIREEFALPVFTSGLRLSVFRAVAGRCIRIGMRGEPGEVESFPVLRDKSEQLRYCE